MKHNTHLEHRASCSQSKHEGEPSLGLCDRLDRTRDNSQRQLPTDHDYAVPTREYQTDQSSLKSAEAVARSVLGKQQTKQPHRISVDRVTPYQANSLIEPRCFWTLARSLTTCQRRFSHGRSFRQLFAGLLAHHVLGVPIPPVRVGFPNPRFMLSVRHRSANHRRGEVACRRIVVSPVTRPGSRLVTSCSSQPLPSGSLKETNE